MSTGPNKPDKHVPNESGRGGKLARRARSFKEDFLDILSQMRSPSGGGSAGGGSVCGGSGTSGGGSTGGGSPAMGGSPKQPPRSPKPRTSSTSDTSHDDRNPLADLDTHVRQVQNALKHFRDVVSKNKLEVIPGNGTVVLESITTIHSVLKTYVFIEQSSTLVSATNQVYQSLAKLIKLCDDVLLGGEKVLNKRNVSEVLQQVEEAVQNLVMVASAKIAVERGRQQSGGGMAGSSSGGDKRGSFPCDPPLRSSLPDIPLTPRERQILEQTSQATPLHSSESIADTNHPTAGTTMTTPPPKPPLPATRVWLGESPPPLPPKRKSGSQQAGGPPSHSMERLSLRSDTSSLGSLDSMLNTTSSRDDEELRVLMDEDTLPDTSLLSHGIGSLVNGSQTGSCCWDSSCSNVSDRTHLTESPDPPPSLHHSSLTTNNIGSFSTQSSGFVSSKSYTSQSYSSTTSVTTKCSSSFSSTEVRQQHQSTSQQHQSTSLQHTSATAASIASATSVATATSSSSSSSVFLQDRSRGGSPTATTTDGGDVVDASISTPTPPPPPALPVKKRSRRERQPSQYDNVQDMMSAGSVGGGGVLSPAIASAGGSSPDSNKPPPLPIKKKHIMAYMEMFGNCSQPSSSEFLRHSVHAYSMMQADWQKHEVTLSSTQSCSFNMVSHTSNHESTMMSSSSARMLSDAGVAGMVPPALPPKKGRYKQHTPGGGGELSVGAQHQVAMAVLPQSAPPQIGSAPPPIITPPPPSSPLPTVAVVRSEPEGEDMEMLPVVTNGGGGGSGYVVAEGSPLYDLDVSKLLVFKKPEEEGPDVRGGHPDALVIHATKANKNDFLYQEAFLTTYRTFLAPLELIRKLCARHQWYSCCPDQVKQRAAREAFSLLVRVVSDLTVSDLVQAILESLMEFVYQLLCRGELSMAKALRVKILEKYNAKQLTLAANLLLSSQNIYTRQSSLMDFKSDQVAEQMTLLDSELFMKIEIPEVLIWAQEQNEERSPNLTQFTEHFNKMSYWARSRILEQSDAKDRERYVVKFIKIMKHLRKINNFNSYLALLSALDSAPIRRLEWQKQITEGLKEYCALIDSSSSFRAYRQALAETQPPCIPYIGLVLQDLTFVHIGNSDCLSDGVINFSKRWQQFNIVENMKRFKKGTYNFKKNDRIIAFFSNFDEFLSEEAMWQISESIKPRGSKKSNQ